VVTKVTQPSDVPSAVQGYLKQAAPRDARLRAELHANLHQRMLDHLTAGCSEPDAWEAALSDFGPAVSPWPRIINTLLAVGIFGGAAVAAAARLHLGLP
jgi:hypothetical protein